MTESVQHALNVDTEGIGMPHIQNQDQVGDLVRLV